LETGGHAAGPMWLSWMRVATAGQPVEDWPSPPPGVTQVVMDREAGCLLQEGDRRAVREVFMAGSEPTRTCDESEAPGQDAFFQTPR
jgi:membrane carboxypeptidase/penicillin-binding protein